MLMLMIEEDDEMIRSVKILYRAGSHFADLSLLWVRLDRARSYLTVSQLQNNDLIQKSSE